MRHVFSSHIHIHIHTGTVSIQAVVIGRRSEEFQVPESYSTFRPSIPPSRYPVLLLSHAKAISQLAKGIPCLRTTPLGPMHNSTHTRQLNPPAGKGPQYPPCNMRVSSRIVCGNNVVEFDSQSVHPSPRAQKTHANRSIILKNKSGPSEMQEVAKKRSPKS
jgi:hypothetical protein